MPILKDIILDGKLSWEKSQEFRLRTRNITALVERNLPKIHTPDFWRIWFTCSNTPPIKDFAVIAGVLEVHVETDPNCFFELDATTKNEFTLSSVAAGLNKVAQHYGDWQRLFEIALQNSSSLTNQYFWPARATSSPNRKWKSQLWYSHELNRFTAYLIVTDKQKQEVARAFVFEAPPSEFQFVPLMFAPEWISSDEIVVGDHRWKWDSKKLRLTKK
jgi:hypothetical protein